jgi:fructuronate reductase/mannitol 2-dehydrogenase
MDLAQRPDAAAPQPLTDATLQQPPEALTVPSYDRDRLRPGIVHFSVGAFHRAHQALYLDELAERGVRDWGVVGVSLHSSRVKEALEDQDLLYTVVQRSPEGDDARVIGTLAAYLYAPEDPEAVFAMLADERIRIVSLTVTGPGYHVDVASGEFVHDDDVEHDLRDPQAPTTFLAYVVEGLRRRRDAGIAPFTLLSCDNVPRNGDITRTAVVSFARLRDPGLADWIDEHVCFPNGMVDRITPGTTDDAPELVAREFGIADREPVVAEPFRQWILEDSFCNDRPPLEEVGVQFVDDVAPYELMKKRLLNGSHTALGHVGSLLGHRTTDEAMADELCGDFIAQLMRREVLPVLPEVPGVDLEEYCATLLTRFSNPCVHDELDRLAQRGSTKMPSYLLPSLHDARAAGSPHDLLTTAVACWMVRLRGVDADGREIDLQDARGDELRELAVEGGTDPRPLLGDRAVFGDLGEDESFATRLQEVLASLEERGPRETIRAVLDLDDALVSEAAA